MTIETHTFAIKPKPWIGLAVMSALSYFALAWRTSTCPSISYENRVLPFDGTQFL